jgi:hypothetical protein
LKLFFLRMCDVEDMRGCCEQHLGLDVKLVKNTDRRGI